MPASKTISQDHDDQQLLQRFFEALEQTQHALLAGRVQGDQGLLARYFQGLLERENGARQLLRAEAPGFNVFRIIKLDHYETKLHTPLLGHLLDPRASHGQGRLFLDAFFGALGHDEQALADISRVVVREEVSTANGRIDLLINYRLAGLARAVVIENKIYAADQPDQLERYVDYLRRIRKLAINQMHVVYLTPQGAKPDSYSVSPRTARALRKHNRLQAWSYRKHIRDLLEEALPRVGAAHVRYQLQQYIQLIKQL